MGAGETPRKAFDPRETIPAIRRDNSKWVRKVPVTASSLISVQDKCGRTPTKAYIRVLLALVSEMDEEEEDAEEEEGRLPSVDVTIRQAMAASGADNESDPSDDADDGDAGENEDP